MLSWLAAAAPGPVHALDFKDGRWHVLVTTEIRGARVRVPGPLLYEHCFTRADIEPHLTSSNAPCRAVEVRRTDTEMSWRLQCREDAGEVKGQGRVKFRGDRLEGVVVTTLRHPEESRVTQRIQARRVGVCDMPGEALRRAPGVPLPDYQSIAPQVQ